MDWLFWFLWFGLPWCFVNARLANLKGRSEMRTFLLSLAFSPIVGWAYISVAPSRIEKRTTP